MCVCEYGKALVYTYTCSCTKHTHTRTQIQENMRENIVFRFYARSFRVRSQTQTVRNTKIPRVSYIYVRSELCGDAYNIPKGHDSRSVDSSQRNFALRKDRRTHPEYTYLFICIEIAPFWRGLHWVCCFVP